MGGAFFISRRIASHIGSQNCRSFALAKLAEEVKEDLEKDDKYIVSVKTIKKTEDIEKLARNIRSRLKRY